MLREINQRPVGGDCLQARPLKALERGSVDSRIG